MKKKMPIRCASGFALGAAAMLIVPALINHAPVSLSICYSERLLERVGSPASAVLLTLLVIGLFGMLCMGGTLFYEIETWSLAKATAAHYLSMALGYLLVAWALCWDMPPKLLLLVEGLMTVGFFLIWLIMYLRCKAQVRELNELIKKQNTPGGEN